jgi:hypothetical protein
MGSAKPDRSENDVVLHFIPRHFEQIASALIVITIASVSVSNLARGHCCHRKGGKVDHQTPKKENEKEKEKEETN